MIFFANMNIALNKLLKIIICQNIVISFELLCISSTVAQITPDSTLTNSSNVKIEGNTNIITGGTQVENNLFHSFNNFSIPKDVTASFQEVKPNITNIFSRVTGSNISQIDGKIELLRSNANLFLINPNGILFGKNASLNIGGSFIATTAESLIFEDSIKFSAIKSQTQPLLSVKVPIGLQMGKAPGEIRYQSSTLQVTPNKTIAFIGGFINLEGGTLNAARGNIELGSLGDNASVNLIAAGNNLTFDYPEIKNSLNIEIKNALLDVSGSAGGSIKIEGKQVSLTQNTRIGSGTSGNFDGGTIKINASQLTLDNDSRIRSDIIGLNIVRPKTGTNIIITSDQIKLDNTSFISSTSSNAGNAGNITITTNKLSLEKASQINSQTSGSGRTGDLTIKANDFIRINGGRITNQGQWSATGLFTQANLNSQLGAEGGKVSITTNKLEILDGAQITTSTFGAGKAGLLEVKASQVEIAGSALTPNGEQFQGQTGLPVNSGLYTSVSSRASGKGGDLILLVDNLTLRKGGVLQSLTFGVGDAGNITVKPLNETGLIELIGTDAKNLFPTAIVASSGGITNVTARVPTATGKSGNIRIETRELQVKDGAAVAVGSINPNATNEGKGNLDITAENIKLNNNARLVAETASGDGGNINLALNDLLLLSSNSQISTTAGVEAKGGDGGNVKIQSPLIAALGKNNDITANAFTGKGGQINITTQGIFGIEKRRTTPNNGTNDIDASSQFGLSGDIIITQPEVDPRQGLLELPTNLVDASQQISAVCNPGSRYRQSSFAITGRGGLPMSPGEPLEDTTTYSQWVQITENQQAERTVPKTSTNPQISVPIIEAQGWLVDKKGKIHLVAHINNTNSNNPPLFFPPPSSCPSLLRGS
jgi:filamentous hemagglutinin family protein